MKGVPVTKPQTVNSAAIKCILLGLYLMAQGEVYSGVEVKPRSLT